MAQAFPLPPPAFAKATAQTGRPVEGFGEGGYVDLSRDVDRPGADVRCISTPIVSNDDVVAQVIPAGESGNKATPGHIRGYDPRTGERLWIFHVVPQGDDFGVDSWDNESWRYTGHTGVWTQLTVDEELGYLFSTCPPRSRPTTGMAAIDRVTTSLPRASCVSTSGPVNGCGTTSSFTMASGITTIRRRPPWST